MAYLSKDRFELLQSILAPLAREQGLTHDQIAAMTAPPLSRSNIARIIEENVRLQISRLRSFRPFCQMKLACELFHLLAFLRGSTSSDLFPLHEWSLAQHVADDGPGVQDSILLVDQALKSSGRILLICRGLPTFLCEETQAIKLVHSKMRLFGLDARKYCSPKLDLAAYLHHIWFHRPVDFEMLLRLSIFIKMRRRIPPFENFDLDDTNTVLDQLLHQCIHKGRHRLRFLDDLQDGTNQRQMKLLAVTGTMAHCQSVLFHRRLPGTFNRRYLTQLDHPCAQHAIDQAESMAASVQRRLSESERKMTNIAILQLFRYPSRSPLDGEPEILGRIRKLLGRRLR